MVIAALAFSPVRTAVVPPAVPAEPSEALKAAVAKVANRVTHIAEMFGIDASAAPKRKKPASGARNVPRPPAIPAAEVSSDVAEATVETDDAPAAEPTRVDATGAVESTPEVATTVDTAAPDDAEPGAGATPAVDAPVEEAAVEELAVEEAPVAAEPEAPASTESGSAE